MIERWDARRDGNFSERSMRHKLEHRGYAVSRYVYAPGTHFPEHTHGVDKIDAVISGRFRITVDGRDHILEAGDCIEVPRGVLHSATVVGDEPVVSLDATKSP